MKNRYKYSLLVVLLIIIALLSTLSSAENLQIHYIDVGQGDSILIQIPGPHSMLIDAGEQTSGSDVVSYIQNQNIDKLDIVIGTHPHADHIGGLISVLEEIKVEKVIDSGRVHTSKTYENYLTLIDQKNIQFELGRAGQTFKLGDAQFQILHPDHVNYDLNNCSVVILMQYEDVKFLFTGDAEEAAETSILSSFDNINAQILKVGHHGSRTSTTSSFLSAITPKIAIIMCGENNRYGHPHNETISKIKQENIKIYRTDIHGNIIIDTNGKNYEIKTEKNITETLTNQKEKEGLYIGSISSDKYHYPSCRWAKNIKEENKIWFNSVE